MPNQQLLLANVPTSSAVENPGHILMTDPARCICTSHLAMKSVKGIFSSFVRIGYMGSHICSNVAAFGGIYFTFENTSDLYSRVSDAETPHRY